MTSVKSPVGDLVLRRLLWLRHGCPIVSLYGDDGEMQCSECGIDFKRMDPELIDKAFRRIGERKLADAIELLSCASCGHFYDCGLPAICNGFSGCGKPTGA